MRTLNKDLTEVEEYVKAKSIDIVGCFVTCVVSLWHLCEPMKAAIWLATGRVLAALSHWFTSSEDTSTSRLRKPFILEQATTF